MIQEICHSTERRTTKEKIKMYNIRLYTESQFIKDVKRNKDTQKCPQETKIYVEEDKKGRKMTKKEYGF